MIGYLRGKPLELASETVIIDVAGVGYEVRASARALGRAAVGKEIALFIHTHIREDAHVLYGFIDREERDLFRTLLQVSGIGPKTALALVSAFTPNEIVRAVQASDSSALKTPGVGPKIVKRLISELQPVFGEAPAVRGKTSAASSGVLQQEVAAALTQLGYHEREIEQLLREVKIEGLTTEMALKQVLRKVSR